MLSTVDYASLLQYSPRGNLDISATSRKVKNIIKAGRIGTENFTTRISEIFIQYQVQLTPFLNKEVTLVPTPRSSPIREGDMWPALEICKMLSLMGGGTVATCLARHTAIRKSSLYFHGDDRPSIDEQYDSMSVEDYVPTANITLVDDVLTLGRTTIAAASRLAEKFPLATIRVFAMIKTKGLTTDIETIRNVEVGTITYNDYSKKCSRNP